MAPTQPQLLQQLCYHHARAANMLCCTVRQSVDRPPLHCTHRPQIPDSPPPLKSSMGLLNSNSPPLKSRMSVLKSNSPLLNSNSPPPLLNSKSPLLNSNSPPPLLGPSLHCAHLGPSLHRASPTHPSLPARDEQGFGFGDRRCCCCCCCCCLLVAAAAAAPADVGPSLHCARLGPSLLLRLWPSLWP